jgi:hypothetical protein
MASLRLPDPLREGEPVAYLLFLKATKLATTSADKAYIGPYAWRKYSDPSKKDCGSYLHSLSEPDQTK